MTDLINTMLIKVIGFKLPEVLFDIHKFITKRYYKYAILLFYFLIVQKGLTILFIFEG